MVRTKGQEIGGVEVGEVTDFLMTPPVYILHILISMLYVCYVYIIILKIPAITNSLSRTTIVLLGIFTPHNQD